MPAAPDAFFVPDGPRFLSTPHTEGPWSAGFQHAGPPSALLARALEGEVADDPALAVCRVTVELLAPIPVAPLEVATSVLRAGRRVRRLEGTLLADGRPVARATGLAIRAGRLDMAPDPAPGPGPLPPEHGKPFRFPVLTDATAGYAAAVEARRVAGETRAGGVAVWLQSRVALVAGEAPSPLQRVMIAADSGNGVAVPLDPRHFTFVNADLSVALHRPLEGAWVCLDAVTARHPTGIGLTETRLWDVRGSLGVALQTLVIEPRRP